jgi:hypothetical protein
MLLPLLMQVGMFTNFTAKLTAGVSRWVRFIKRVGETQRIPFDFLSRLVYPDLVSTGTSTIALYDGVETAPTLTLVGGVVVNQTTASQLITGGSPGCTYLLTCNIIAVSNTTAALVSYITVI